MTTWEGAAVQGGGGSTSYDKEYARRWSRSRAANSSVDRFDHYEEKARAREAAQREADEYRERIRVMHEIDERDGALKAFRADDPEPRTPGPDADDFLERMTEHDAWTKRRNKYLARVEGEALAARIGRRW
ncbi:hypothetical protein ACFY15_07525 [Streptomyces sp. NPDC001373]|uniref:hypothetical protein n=1 Tax=Streptomyces sp. NPDC001373 TaxID=3364565 RepID=UPI00369EF4DB